MVEDIFTKWIEAKAIKTADTNTICDYLEDEIFSRYGCPRTIISDNGTYFQSDKYHNMCQENNITPYYTAIYFQRQNPVERKVQDFKAIMGVLMVGRRDQNLTWDKYLKKALRAQRTRENRATGETPAKALLGYEIALPGQWEIPEFRKNVRTQREETTYRRQKIVERQLNFNEKTYPQQNEPQQLRFRKGETVMVKNHAATDPFAPAWTGPHPVTKVLSEQVYEIDRNGREIRCHIDHLRKAPEGNDVDELEYQGEMMREEASIEEESHASADEGRLAETGVDYGPPTSGTSAQRLCSMRESPRSVQKEKGVREEKRNDRIWIWSRTFRPSRTTRDQTNRTPRTQRWTLETPVRESAAM